VSADAGVPQITGILETVLYVADLDRAEQFYRSVMALKQIGKESGRHVFFRVGTGVLLLFHAERTRRSATLPPHGADGEIHVCFTVAPAEYDAWKQRVQEHGVVIQKEITWPVGRSFYFRDPDGNLLELADADIWPR
jgi:catechol 2,3-dioxygenase-like lactoylglutathione lyase family enzyme